MSKGQVQVATIFLTSVIAAIGTWGATYVFNSPAQAANAISAVQTNIDKVNSKLSILCNDYGQTVSRLDQNMQIIGRALKTSVVVGKSDLDPCK